MERAAGTRHILERIDAFQAFQYMTRSSGVFHTKSTYICYIFNVYTTNVYTLTLYAAFGVNAAQSVPLFRSIIPNGTSSSHGSSWRLICVAPLCIVFKKSLQSHLKTFKYFLFFYLYNGSTVIYVKHGVIFIFIKTFTQRDSRERGTEVYRDAL